MTKIARADGDARGLFKAAVLDDLEWQALAPAAGGVGRFVMDLEGGLCDIDQTLQRIMGIGPLDGPVPVSLFFDHMKHEDDRTLVADRIESVRHTGARFEVEYRFTTTAGRTIWIAAAGRVLTTADGRQLLIGVNQDVTERRNAQERAELLAGEMAHRIKNVFTLVQSMFNMAARKAETRDDLVSAFSGRLQALGAVNALTFSHPDRKVCLRDLLATVLGPLVDAGRITMTQPEAFDLNGAAAQTVVLSINELMTNATKHGALRHADGMVAVEITAGPEEFVLSWAETSPEAIDPPGLRKGFGMRVLTSMTAATFSGRPEFDWRPDGLTFRCTWPAPQFAWRPEPGYSERLADEVAALARHTS